MRPLQLPAGRRGHTAPLRMRGACARFRPAAVLLAVLRPSGLCEAHRLDAGRDPPRGLRRRQMDAFHSVQAVQRETDLAIRLTEYLAVGMEFGLIHQT